jgi:hypothetical protein
MIRNLKILIAAIMALTAFGALSTSAHAAEEKFHCTVEPCTVTLAPDETAGTTTAHHVFVVKGKTAGGAEASASFTCNQLKGEATSATKTTTELAFTNLSYQNSAGEEKCKVGASETVMIHFTECTIKFKFAFGFPLLAQIELGGTCKIHFTIKGTTCLDVKPFTSTGLGYHDSAIGGAKKVVTAIANFAVPNSALELQNVGNANCSALGMASTTGATYTTGNTLLKAENGGVAAEAWFE